MTPRKTEKKTPWLIRYFGRESNLALVLMAMLIIGGLYANTQKFKVWAQDRYVEPVVIKAYEKLHLSADSSLQLLLHNSKMAKEMERRKLGDSTFNARRKSARIEIEDRSSGKL